MLPFTSRGADSGSIGRGGAVVIVPSRFHTCLGLLVLAGCAPPKFRSPANGGPSWYEAKSEYRDIAPRLSAGFFQRRGGAIYDQHPTIIGFEGNDDVRIDRLFLHELAHRFISFHFPGTPIWLNEGLATFHETTRFQTGQVVVGDAPVGMGYSAEHGWYAWDYRGPYRMSELPPAATVRALGPEDFYAQNETDEKIAEAHKQRHYLAAWALTHVLMLGPPERRARLLSYLNRLAAGESNAWEKTFDAATLAEVDRAYQAFLERHATAHVTIAFPEEQALDVKARVMAPAEVHWLWAVTRWSGDESERLRARQDVASSIRLDPKRADGYVLRAAFSLERGDQAAASSDLERALALEPENRNALAVRAKLLLDTEAKKPEAEQDWKEAMATFADLKVQAKTAREFLLIAAYEGVRGRFDAAVRYASRAVRTDSSCWECYWLGAELEFARGGLDVAVPAMRVALSLGSEEGADTLLPRLREFEAAQTECKQNASACGPRRLQVNVEK